MARVRMNVSIAGVNFSYQPRQIVDISDELAAAWIACGHASLVEEAPAVGGPVEPTEIPNAEPRSKRKR